MNGDSRNYTHYETDSTDTLGKKLHHHTWTRSWTFRSERLVGLTGQPVN